MRQRAAAIYVVFFLVVAAGAYAVIGAAEQPTISLDDPDYTLSENDSFRVDDQEYTVTSVSAGEAEAEWTNESAIQSETWDNEAAVELEGESYVVVIPNESDPSSFTLREEQEVDQETTERDGTEYVVVEEGDNVTLVPRDEYLPEPETREFSEGDTFDFNGNQTTVEDVSESSAELQWQAPQTNTVRLQEGEASNLGGQSFVPHFPDDSTLQLTSDIDAYEQQIADIGEFDERIRGLWGVIVVSLTAAILMVLFAFLPARE